MMDGEQVYQSMESSTSISAVPENALTSGQKALKKAKERRNSLVQLLQQAKVYQRECWKLHGKPANLKNMMFSDKNNCTFLAAGGGH